MNTKQDGITLHIFEEDAPLDPRTNMDNLGKFYAWHTRYEIGDKHSYASLKEFLKSDEGSKMYCSLPVYMLDHSGISFSTTPFNDKWDSGLVGIIYCTKEDADNWFYGKYKKENVIEELEGEILDYNDYVSGKWYGYSIEGLNGETLECESYYLLGDSFKRMLVIMRENASEEYHGLFDKLIKELNMENEM